MNVKLITVAVFAGVLGVECMAQKAKKKSSEPQKWDATLIQVKSSADGTMQPCWYWVPENASTVAVPLIVGLHTWSADYTQLNHYQTVQKEAKRRGWAFVGPNFRGKNSTPAGCGSDLAVRSEEHTSELQSPS